MKRAKRLIAPPRSNVTQTLPERIRWLRANLKPYMSQDQLALFARVPLKTIVMIEKGDLSANNMKMNTLRKIAHALGCSIYINIKPRPSPVSAECQPLGPELPPIPKRKRKVSEGDRRLALLHGSSPWKSYRRRPRPSRQKETSDTVDTETSAEQDKAE